MHHYNVKEVPTLAPPTVVLLDFFPRGFRVLFSGYVYVLRALGLKVFKALGLEGSRSFRL